MYQMGFLLSQVPDKASSCWGICIRSLHDIAKKGYFGGRKKFNESINSLGP